MTKTPFQRKMVAEGVTGTGRITLSRPVRYRSNRIDKIRRAKGTRGNERIRAKKTKCDTWYSNNASYQQNVAMLEMSRTHIEKKLWNKNYDERCWAGRWGRCCKIN